MLSANIFRSKSLAVYILVGHTPVKLIKNELPFGEFSKYQVISIEIEVSAGTDFHEKS